jgi:hypothetical protein
VAGQCRGLSVKNQSLGRVQPRQTWFADRAALCALLEGVDAEICGRRAIESPVPVAMCRQSSLGESPGQRLQEGAADVACVTSRWLLHSVLGIIRRETLADAASGDFRLASAILDEMPLRPLAFSQTGSSGPPWRSRIEQATASLQAVPGPVVSLNRCSPCRRR